MKTRTRSKLFSVLIALLALSLCLMAGTVFTGAADTAHNDVSVCNTEIGETQAVTVNYNGEFTGRYGMQAYAGLSGRAWIIGNPSGLVDHGVGSHPLGSNASDGRSNFGMELSVNSTVAGDAYVYLYVESGVYGEPIQVKVNDGEAFTYNIYGESYQSSIGTPYRPNVIKVTLVEGVNTITLTTGTNYTGWYNAFAISPVEDYKVIEYNGDYTGVYGTMMYAKVAGPAWNTNGGSAYVNLGKESTVIGSNNGDGRNNLSMTYTVNSTVAGKAYMQIVVQATKDGEPVGVIVNDGEPITVNLQAGLLFNTVEVTLAEGKNTIVITTGENYAGWYHGISIAPYSTMITAPAVSGQTIVYPTGTYVESAGSMTVSALSIGLNAFDNSADYGKTGSATYEVYANEAGSYRLGMFALAGHGLANRVKLTVNGNVLNVSGNNYVSLSTAGGWGSKSWTYVDMELVQGVNTIILENQLTTVNANRDTEVAEGTEGAVKVSNWWMDELSFTKNLSVQLELDTTNVQKSYNLGWKPTSTDGVVVYLVVDGVRQEAPLSANEYSVVINGDLVEITYTGTAYESVQSANYSLSATSEGMAHEGKTLELTAEGVGATSWYEYAKVVGEGTGVCEGRLFYMFIDRPVYGGYLFGSNGAGEWENRQMTLTLTIDNKGEAGNYIFKNYVDSNNYNLAFAQLKVNDGEYADVNIHSHIQSNEYFNNNYLVYLNEGINTITLKLQDQYVGWFHSFEITPVNYEDKAEYTVQDSTREGVSGFYTPENKLLATNKNHSMTFYVSATEAGKYDLTFYVSKTTGKSFKVSIDGQEAKTLTTIGKEFVSTVVDFTAGNHTVKLIFDEGEKSSIEFFKMVKTACAEVVAIRVDTTEMNLEVEKGTELNIAKLKVYITYKDAEGEELVESDYAVDTTAYNKDVSGTYTIVVYASAYPEVRTTFDVTVKAEKVVNGLEVDASAIASLENGEELDISKIVVKLCYSDNTKLPAMTSDYTVSTPENFDNTVAGEYTFTVSYVQDATISATFTVTVAEAQETSSNADATGCFSAISTAALFGVIAVIGAGFVLAKKKEN